MSIEVAVTGALLPMLIGMDGAATAVTSAGAAWEAGG